MLLTLLGVLVHGEYAQDDILVLDVGSLDQLLETVPVLSRVLGIDGSVGQLGLLQLLLYVLLGSLLALCGQLVVQVVATIG